MSEVQFYQQVTQYRPIFEAREIRRLTRMAFEDWEEGGRKAHEEAVKQGLGLDLAFHMIRVSRTLTYKYRRK